MAGVDSSLRGVLAFSVSQEKFSDHWLIARIPRAIVFSTRAEGKSGLERETLESVPRSKPFPMSMDSLFISMVLVLSGASLDLECLMLQSAWPLASRLRRAACGALSVSAPASWPLKPG